MFVCTWEKENAADSVHEPVVLQSVNYVSLGNSALSCRKFPTQRRINEGSLNTAQTPRPLVTLTVVKHAPSNLACSLFSEEPGADSVSVLTMLMWIWNSVGSHLAELFQSKVTYVCKLISFLKVKFFQRLHYIWVKNHINIIIKKSHFKGIVYLKIKTW